MFTFPVEPGALLHERTRQFTALGIPRPVIVQARSRIRDMWGTGDASWTPVWAAEAERALRADKPLPASLCWGAACFPCLATADRKEAHERQLDAYPVHFLQRRRMARPGVVILSDGMDKLALGGHVDAAIDLGGPTGASGQRIDVPGLPHGMAGIIGNALHLDAMPGPDVIDDLLARFSLREQGLPDRPGGSPLLARTAPVCQSLITGLRWIHSSLWSDWCMKAATSARLIVGLPFIGSRSAAL
ncbi:conserved hypothetical protein [Streptomyces himastatinicus ATCC 53653]|uniref:Uncharacterized protein n=1 Tax=Streptomyces himastatinicus ATCC 53653 TaxID=457427 RepID=D9WQ00_9ACTN|nr:conserved hypothetical protein [Streptomyces himastatinicus ATCC 53653]